MSHPDSRCRWFVSGLREKDWGPMIFCTWPHPKKHLVIDLVSHEQQSALQEPMLEELVPNQGWEKAVSQATEIQYAVKCSDAGGHERPDSLLLLSYAWLLPFILGPSVGMVPNYYCELLWLIWMNVVNISLVWLGMSEFARGFWEQGSLSIGPFVWKFTKSAEIAFKWLIKGSICVCVF